MDKQGIDRLLDRYLKGETNVFENEQVELWLAIQEPERTEWSNLTAVERESWLSNLLTDVQDSLVRDPKVIKMASRKTAWRKIMAAAASVILISMIALYWLSDRNPASPDNLTGVHVAQNQKRKVVLPDGSTVWINALSDLQYPKDFNARTREVYLSGEAYFDIKHVTDKPFIVHTGVLKTTVLGTAFNINAYRNSGQITVTVTRGKVAVSDDHQILGFITPNQQISYDINEKTNHKKQVDAGAYVSWPADLYFDNVTFESAANVLSERFNVDIEFANSAVKSCRFSGTALAGKNLEHILKVICSFNQATYSHTADGKILIDGPGCN